MLKNNPTIIKLSRKTKVKNYYLIALAGSFDGTIYHFYREDSDGFMGAIKDYQNPISNFRF